MGSLCGKPQVSEAFIETQKDENLEKKDTVGEVKNEAFVEVSNK